MVSTFLSNTIGISKLPPQNKVTQPAKLQSEQKEQKKDYSKYALAGMSLVALSTTAGMIYFAKQRGKINKRILQDNEVFRSSSSHITFSEPTASSPIVQKPYESNFSTGSTSNWQSSTTADSKKVAAPKKKGAVVGIIRQISKELNEYLKNCQDNKINPEKVDEILTKAVGEGNVYERPFTATPLHPRGRIKQYTSPNGRIYVLETHEVLGKNVTRLYMQDKDKHLRAYLFPDGSFRLNSYKSDESHFVTTAKGKRWMEKSKFLNNGANKTTSK